MYKHIAWCKVYMVFPQPGLSPLPYDVPQLWRLECAGNMEEPESQALLASSREAQQQHGSKQWGHNALTPDGPELSSTESAAEAGPAETSNLPWYKLRQVQLSLLGYALVRAPLPCILRPMYLYSRFGIAIAIWQLPSPWTKPVLMEC